MRQRGRPFVTCIMPCAPDDSQGRGSSLTIIVLPSGASRNEGEWFSAKLTSEIGLPMHRHFWRAISCGFVAQILRFLHPKVRMLQGSRIGRSLLVKPFTFDLLMLTNGKIAAIALIMAFVACLLILPLQMINDIVFRQRELQPACSPRKLPAACSRTAITILRDGNLGGAAEQLAIAQDALEPVCESVAD